MTRIYNQICEIEKMGKLPYYLFVSKDIYESLRDELGKSVLRNKYLKNGKIVIDIFENLEVVVYGHNSVVDYIAITGINKKTNA
jgi:hypothetical protein